ncbi:MAG: HTH domain-containing protein [archaeon]|nr:HTH domain-containing protein [Nanoarchaeota archaeon]
MKRTKRQLVEDFLRKNTDGLTVTEIASYLKISRNTVAVALAELKGADILRIRPVGMAKLHYLKKEYLKKGKT